jgi:branched-chain amino acid transport system permease protein
MLFWQILVDGFAISSLYALGATGFALIFGVSGVLNLSHGALMVTAVVAAWAAGNDLHVGAYAGAALGVGVGLVATLFTYFLIVRPLQQTRKIREEEKEIFILTATLLWGIMIQELIAYLYTNNAKTVAPIVEGVVRIAGVRTPTNEIFTAVVCWLVIGILWLLVNRTRAGKAVLAASMNPRGVTLTVSSSRMSTSRCGRSMGFSLALPASCSECFSAFRPTASARSPRVHSRLSFWADLAASPAR